MIMGQGKSEHEVKTAHEQLQRSQERERDLQQQSAELNKNQQQLSTSLTNKTTELENLKFSSGPEIGLACH